MPLLLTSLVKRSGLLTHAALVAALSTEDENHEQAAGLNRLHQQAYYDSGDEEK